MMKALTIDALWAWAILAGHKHIENRGWTTEHRGRIAIHAGRNSSRDNEPLRLFDRLHITPPDDEVLQDIRGRILGTIELVEITPYTRDAFQADPFATGPHCWKLANPIWLADPILATGNLGLWNWTPENPAMLTAEGTAPCLLKAKSAQNSNLFSTSSSQT